MALPTGAGKATGFHSQRSLSGGQSPTEGPRDRPSPSLSLLSAPTTLLLEGVKGSEERGDMSTPESSPCPLPLHCCCRCSLHL
jgi:hypothetical protein